MHATVNGRRPGATPGPYDPEDGAALQPATLADLARLEADCNCLPCWCPDAPGRHLRDCHLEAIKRLAAQWTCTGSAGKPGVYRADCDCPQCRMEWALGNLAQAFKDGMERLAEAIEEAGLCQPGREHSTSTLGGVEGVEADLDASERYRRVIHALERYGCEQGEDGNWNCAWPGHEDEHPSMSVNKAPDGSGYILAHCHSGPDCGDNHPDGKVQWLREVSKEIGVPMSIWFPNKKAPEGHEPPFD